MRANPVALGGYITAAGGVGGGTLSQPGATENKLLSRLWIGIFRAYGKAPVLVARCTCRSDLQVLPFLKSPPVDTSLEIGETGIRRESVFILQHSVTVLVGEDENALLSAPTAAAAIFRSAQRDK